MRYIKSYEARKKGVMRRLFPDTNIEWQHYMLVVTMLGMVIFMVVY